MMIEQNYNLDTVPFQSAVPVVHVSQYDSGSRTLKFALIESGSEYDMSNVTGAKINGRKPDNTAFSYDMTISSNVVSIVVTEQMTAVSGRVVAEVVLLGTNDAVLGTANFIIEVEKSPIDEGIISDTDIPILIDFMTGGTAGQIFQRTANGGRWVDPSAVTTKTQWGDIEGNLADQTDLNEELTELNTNLSAVQTALDDKVSSVNEVLPDANGNVSLNAKDIPAEGMGPKDVSGNPIVVTDAVAENAQNLSVDLEPIQDLHGYDHPWPAGGGKNLLNLPDSTQVVNGVTISILDSVITLNGTSTSNSTVTLGNGAFDGTGSFIARADIKIGIVDFWLTGVNIAFGSSDVTFTNDGTALNVGMYFGGGKTFSNQSFKLMVRESSQHYVWEPYSNICPISGRTEANVLRTGKNMLNVGQARTETINGVTFTVNADGTVGATGTADGQHSNLYLIGSTSQYADSDLQEGNYILNGGVSEIASIYVVRNRNGTISSYASPAGSLDDVSFDVQEGDTFRIFLRVERNETVNNVVFKPMIRVSGEGSSFVPYQGSSASVTFPETVYGAEVGVTRGKTLVTRTVIEYDGSDDETWGITSATPPVFRIIKPTNSLSPAVSNLYRYYSSSGTVKEGGFYFGAMYIGVRPGTVETIAEWRALLAENPLVICYTLETPIELALTPAQMALLEGYNILTTDGDTINLRYIGTEASSVQAEIYEFEESTRKLAGSLAMIETSPATANHAVGDFIVFNSQLYKVTVAIASGEVIVVGTNVQATTIADELKAILAQLSA